jgi:hypothetical protein
MVQCNLHFQVMSVFPDIRYTTEVIVPMEIRE